MITSPARVPLPDMIAELKRTHQDRLDRYQAVIRSNKLTVKEANHRIFCLAAAIDELQGRVQPPLFPPGS